MSKKRILLIFNSVFYSDFWYCIFISVDWSTFLTNKSQMQLVERVHHVVR